MPWWTLLIELFVVWLLWAVAGAVSCALKAARSGIPNRGFSFAPIIPFFPLGFWGAAKIIDLGTDSWGTFLVGWLHAVLGVCFMGSIVLSVRRLRSYSRPV